MLLSIYRTVGGTSQLWMINNWSLGVDANGSSSVLTSSWEGPDFYTPYYCSRSKAFFTAPVTGDYTFLATVDDYAQLNATYLNPADQVIGRTFKCFFFRLYPCIQ